MKSGSIYLITMLVLALSLSSCGDGDGGGTVIPTPTGNYEITAGFVDTAKSKSFVAIIERLDQTAESAKNVTVTVDGTTIPLTPGSTDAEATYRSDTIT